MGWTTDSCALEASSASGRRRPEMGGTPERRTASAGLASGRGSENAVTGVALLLVSFPLLLGGAVLFTNAVEWLGRELRLAQGAVGSLLAAVGTALPESLIPVIAVLGGQHGSGEVAVGAIVGAPFMLATIALAL